MTMLSKIKNSCYGNDFVAESMSMKIFRDYWEENKLQQSFIIKRKEKTITIQNGDEEPEKTFFFDLKLILVGCGSPSVLPRASFNAVLENRDNSWQKNSKLLLYHDIQKLYMLLDYNKNLLAGNTLYLIFKTLRLLQFPRLVVNKIISHLVFQENDEFIAYLLCFASGTLEQLREMLDEKKRKIMIRPYFTTFKTKHDDLWIPYGTKLVFDEENKVFEGISVTNIKRPQIGIGTGEYVEMDYNRYLPLFLQYPQPENVGFEITFRSYHPLVCVIVMIECDTIVDVPFQHAEYLDIRGNKCFARFPFEFCFLCKFSVEKAKTQLYCCIPLMTGLTANEAIYSDSLPNRGEITPRQFSIRFTESCSSLRVKSCYTKQRASYYGKYSMGGICNN